MDTLVKKNNKENTKPAAGQKKTETRNVLSKPKLAKPAPLQSKNDLKEEKGVKNTTGKVDPQEQIKPVGKTESDPKTRKTLSQAFRTEQTVRHRKLVAEASKPPSSVPPKPIPGTYKGRVVKSKIDCFRKPSSGIEKTAEVAAAAKATVPKPKCNVGTLSKVRSKSVTVLPASSRPKPQPNVLSRPKSVSDARLNVTSRPASQRQVAPKAPAFARPGPAPPTRPVSTKPVSFIKRKEPVLPTSKPKPAAATSEQKASKPVSASMSKYKVQVESAEERRAKLAEWLATKGKTLKRPPMSDKVAPQSCKPGPQPKPKQEESKVEPEPPKIKVDQPTVEMKVDNQREEKQVIQNKPVFSSSPSHIMNTTLDLLDNSDMDLPVDPEIRLESLVLNLCDKLEAMETPSSCEQDIKTSDGAEPETLGDVKVEEQTDRQYEILEEEDMEVKEESVDSDAEDRKDGEVLEQKKKLFAGETDEEEEETMDSEVVEASVVKYSVKTTPFLQSVKKRIEVQTAPGHGSRCKSAIKDLKFLTPVRRSSRIQRKSSRLPDMLSEHDPCVSSLAELVQLDDADSNAYIYRKNPALLDQLPDHPHDLERLSAERK